MSQNNKAKKIPTLTTLSPLISKFLNDYSTHNKIPKNAIIEHLILKLMRGEVEIILCQPSSAPVENHSNPKEV